MNEVILSFPGLGIGAFNINPVAFTIPIGEGIEVRWYGILIVLGMMLAFTYCAYRARQEGVSFNDLIDIALFTIVAAILGARMYYVISRSNVYFPIKSWEDFGELFAIQNGGLGIYGGLIAGAIAIFAVTKYKKWSGKKILKFFDSVAPAVFIGQILGRWGNFCNGEAFGEQLAATNPLYFIRMGIISETSVSTFKTFEMVYVHPTFLYESLWNLLGFIILHFVYRKKKFDGQNLLSYLAWYGFGRMFVESLRTDSLPLIFGTEAGGLNRLSLVVGFLCFAIATPLIVFFLVKASKAKKAGTYAAPVFLTEEEMKANWNSKTEKKKDSAKQKSESAEPISEPTEESEEYSESQEKETEETKETENTESEEEKTDGTNN